MMSLRQFDHSHLRLTPLHLGENLGADAAVLGPQHDYRAAEFVDVIQAQRNPVVDGGVELGTPPPIRIGPERMACDVGEYIGQAGRLLGLGREPGGGRGQARIIPVSPGGPGPCARLPRIVWEPGRGVDRDHPAEPAAVVAGRGEGHHAAHAVPDQHRGTGRVQGVGGGQGLCGPASERVARAAVAIAVPG
jgi:hypothetical protein